jgi:hypothetical protein
MTEDEVRNDTAPTCGDEAAEALEAASRKLSEQATRWARIHRVTDSLLELRRKNHFSELMDKALRGDA